MGLARAATRQFNAGAEGRRGSMPNTRSVIVRYGLIFGGILALIGTADAVTSHLLLPQLFAGVSTTDPGQPSPLLGILGVAALVGCAIFLVTLGIFFLAGIFTARQTGTISSGVFAGMLAGGTGPLVGGVVGIVLNQLYPIGAAVASNPYAPTPDSSLALVTGIIGGIFGVAFDVGLGAGLGALGALIGRNQFQKVHPELAQAGAVYSPYPAYPGAPPMGAYPPPGAFPPPPGAYPAYPPADQMPPTGGPGGYPPAGGGYPPPPPAQ